MKKIKINRILKNFIIILVFIFLLEIIFRLINSNSLFNWALWRIFLLDAVLALLLSMINTLFKPWITSVLNLIEMLLFSLYAFLQLGFYNFVGTYISLHTSGQLGKVNDYISDFFRNFRWEFYFILLPFLLLIIYYIFFNKKIENKTNNINNYFVGFLSLIGICCCFYLSIIIPFMQNKYQAESNTKLFDYPDLQIVSVSQFGIIGYGSLDAKSYLMPEKNVGIRYYQTKEVKKVSDKDKDWLRLNKKTTNNNLKTLNNYFLSQDEHKDNDYTGLLKDKNIIFILMESAGSVVLDYPEYFPNLYYLSDNGWNFTNNYSPRNSCATGNNEMILMTSMFPTNNSCTTNSYKNNQYPQSVFNVFENMGYSTSSYHDYTDAFYDRSTSHYNMGSNNYYDANDLGIETADNYFEWPSDLELFEKGIPMFKEQDKFVAFFTTVTGHQPYMISSTYGDKYLELFEDLDVSKTDKRYLSKMKEFDNALGYLLGELKKEKILDDTVLVLTGDHYPYAIGQGTYQQICSYDVSTNNEVDRTPFIIYNSSIKGEKIDKYTTIMNILPTVYNLFGATYDSRLYFGEDILSDSYTGIAIFEDSSWQSNKAFYDSGTGDIKYLSKNKYTDAEIITINKRINEKIGMSNLAIRNNYFKYLSDNINIYDSEKGK